MTMEASRRPDPPPAGMAGADPRWRPSLGYLAVALAIVAGALGFAAMSSPSSTAAVPAPAPAVPRAQVAYVAPGPAPAPAPETMNRRAPQAPAAAPAAVIPPAVPRMREPDADQSPDLSDYVNPGEVPTMAEVIERLHAAGVYGGLAAFPPPGTRPPLVGLAVPDDYELPAGYVRHHQSTDDGQDIEPILMYSPDHRFVDAAGVPVAIPPDRVVPPEFAPPGLPLRHVVVPAPIDPQLPRR